MNDFPSSGHIVQEPRDLDARSRYSDSDISALAGGLADDSHGIVTHAPKESFRLGYFDVCCLVINRMIGSCKIPA